MVNCWNPNSILSLLDVSQTQLDTLDKFRTESLKSNQSIWFGHYTTSTVVSPSPGVRDVMRCGSACGCAGCREQHRPPSAVQTTRKT